jgi:hypothetical protein
VVGFHVHVQLWNAPEQPSQISNQQYTRISQPSPTASTLFLNLPRNWARTACKWVWVGYGKKKALVFPASRRWPDVGIRNVFLYIDVFFLDTYHARTLHFTCEKCGCPLLLLVPVSIMANVEEGAWSYCDLAWWDAVLQNVVMIQRVISRKRIFIH